MNRDKFPLIFFTILTQAAVGIYLFTQLVRFIFIIGIPVDISEEFAIPLLVLTIGLLLAGGLVSIGHLGKPIRSINTLRNIRNSWLSRELYLGGTFGLVVLIELILNLLAEKGAYFHILIPFTGVFVGIGFVYAIGRLYMLRTVPAWNSPATPISFFITTILLGSVLVGGFIIMVSPVILIERIASETLIEVFGWLGILSCVAIFAQLMVDSWRTISLAAGKGAAYKSGRIIIDHYRWLLLMVALLSIVGLFSILYLLSEITQFPLTKAQVVFETIFILSVVTREILARFLFYAAHVREGL
jgi:anaerobic dimethyl sulfoxide reductase subunit C (anchor subunit)